MEISMEYRNLGKSGLRVSRLCLGCMMFGDVTPEDESLAIIQAALDAGVNFLDTADKYGNGASERVVGKALAGRRDEIVLATKVGLALDKTGPNLSGASRKHIREAAEASLTRLGTDYIDLYYLHTFDAATPLEESLGALEDLVRGGKVLYAGVSNFRAWQVVRAVGLQELRGWDKLAAVQPLYNMANRDAEVELLPACRELGLGVCSYSPLARGVLTGKYKAGEEPPADSRAARGNVRLMQTEYREANFTLAEALRALALQVGCTASQLALAWVMANRLVTAPLIGPRTLAQLQDNLGAMDVSITPALEAAAETMVPPGEHAGRGYQDPGFPVTGRVCG
jgi:aryl-alcohol dehydrogenase-like predicted oxidoreductase